MLYGEPRVTHDIDFIVFLRTEDIARLPEVFPAPEFYLPPPEAIAAGLARETKGQFNIIPAESGLTADPFTANRDEFPGWAWRNHRQYSVAGLTIHLAPPEYVIVRKPEYFREGGSDKHLRAIRAMPHVSGDQLDRAALREWVVRRGVTAEWPRASA